MLLRVVLGTHLERVSVCESQLRTGGGKFSPPTRAIGIPRRKVIFSRLGGDALAATGECILRDKLVQSMQTACFLMLASLWACGTLRPHIPLNNLLWAAFPGGGTAPGLGSRGSEGNQQGFVMA